MSRVGNKPITIPEGVRVSYKRRVVTVEGPLGTLQQELPPTITLKITDNLIQVKRKREYKRIKALHGLFRALIANMVEGVSKGFSKDLDVIGLGYRAERKGNGLLLSIGYGHPIFFVPPEGIKLELIVPKKGERQDFTPGTNFRLRVSGCDKALVGQVAAIIRNLRKPNVYKGIGIRYYGESIRLKPGKAGAS